MASLRARLLAALLALTAIGLLLLGGITYVEQRSFELTRLDDQVRGALPLVEGVVSEQGVATQPRGEDDGGPPRGAPEPVLPVGTYGELRNASGERLASHVFAYGQNITADPKLPSSMPLGRVFTVSGENGDENSYRVYANHVRGGNTAVVAAPLGEIDSRLNRLLAVESLVILAVLLVLGSVAWAVVRVGLLPLDRMGHTARTEVGRLGLALNAMLDRLERAFTRQRQSEDRLRRFLADASHELRTPLASIRGYAELFRMGAARKPEEIDKAMQRIEDEAARMGVLVEDLLTLARLDEIAEAPHGEVDLATLAEDAVSDARATSPDREIALTANGSAAVLGDAHQLRQVLGNLLRNALVHTPAGTGIDVSVSNGGGRVRLRVRDHGPGLPTDDADELFERFWRAEGGRERGRAGAGLGLAIVAAIVDAHGGEVGAANAPDGGAIFSVDLPQA
jgi:two-component system OmpR family sensor kinase